MEYATDSSITIYDDNDLRRASHNYRINVRNRMKDLLDMIDEFSKDGPKSKLQYLFGRPQLAGFDELREYGYRAEKDRIDWEEQDYF
jgi:hypothetical protein